MTTPCKGAVSGGGGCKSGWKIIASLTSRKVRIGFPRCRRSLEVSADTESGTLPIRALLEWKLADRVRFRSSCTEKLVCTS